MERVREVAQEIVAETPDATNPREHGVTGTCLYTRLDGVNNPPNAAPRCLGGEVLVRLGLRLPEEDQLVSTSLDKDKLDMFAMDYLWSLQNIADQSFGPWSDVLEELETRIARESDG